MRSSTFGCYIFQQRLPENQFTRSSENGKKNGGGANLLGGEHKFLEYDSVRRNIIKDVSCAK